MRRITATIIAAALSMVCLDLTAHEGSSDASAPKDTTAQKWEFLSKENLPRIEELPDPFLKPDGSRVQTPEEWPEQREYIKAMLSHYLYGSMPPAPTNTKGQILYTRVLYGGKASMHVIKITFSPDDNPDCEVSFIAEMIVPNVEEKVPVIIWNQFRNKYDGCPEEEEIVCNRHYAIIEYDKEQLAEDNEKAFEGPLAKAYPGYTWGAIAMWAFGTSRIIDYLETTDFADMDKIVSTGHSRGGKTAICAAIYDDRIALCAANGSGTGGAGTLRFLGSRMGEGYGIVESAGFIYDYFPYWWAEEFGKYGKRENDLNHETMAIGNNLEKGRSILHRPYAVEGVGDEAYLPFDGHFIRAAIAPRALITTDGSADTWANPFGSQLSWVASDEVYKFLGAEGKNAIHYREGSHYYLGADWIAVADFCDMIFYGKEPASHLRISTEPSYYLNPPAKHTDPITGGNLHYSWKRPDAE